MCVSPYLQLLPLYLSFNLISLLLFIFVSIHRLYRSSNISLFLSPSFLLSLLFLPTL
ncbi:hypothetical protein CSUI_007198 [Cystoisospora suis]|uniref:Transmembrane protein n=1 Tax=Cystoisospora suis TaxID=483139 RepID=A0A2C6KRQ4_9APIC|nr:hypothetical protein CSUI_007198 [Cystoisospora suis]